MMSKNTVLPMFSGVQNRAAAEALSEPFVRPDFFDIQFTRAGFEPADLGPDDVAAMGVSYLTGDGAPGFEFAMHPLAPMPYSTAQEFVAGYEARLAKENQAARSMTDNFGETGIKFWQERAIEYAKREGLKAMSAYALFNFERVGYAGGVIAAQTIVRESSLEGREEQMRLEREAPGFVSLMGSLLGELAGASEEEVEKAKRDIATNNSQGTFGLFVATIHMPRPQDLRRIVDAHPQIDGFLSLARKEKREMLRAEKKASRQSNE